MLQRLALGSICHTAGTCLQLIRGAARLSSLAGRGEDDAGPSSSGGSGSALIFDGWVGRLATSAGWAGRRTTDHHTFQAIVKITSIQGGPS